jgi:protein SCO1
LREIALKPFLPNDAPGGPEASRRRASLAARWQPRLIVAVGLVLAMPVSCLAQAQPIVTPVAPQMHPIYHYGLKVTQSDGKTLALEELAGRPVIMTMFFATCPGVCPIMTEEIKHVTDGLAADKRANLHVLMVSFDDNDTLQQLEAYKKAHGLDSSMWIIAKATPAVSKTLGELLDVRFQKLPNGSYSHTAMVDLVDENGDVQVRVPGTSLDDPLFAFSVDQMLSKHPAPAHR